MEDDVAALLAVDDDRSMKSMAYKTVDTFAGIMGRKLFLKEGKVARTNGWLIEVPFDHPQMYQLVEHEISHPLFGSDPTAKVIFVEDYSKKISLVARRRGVEVDERTLRRALDMMVGILEDERVISLWSLLYMGSGMVLRWMQHRDTEKFVPEAHEDLVTMFCCVAGAHQIEPGKLSRFVPYFVEALRKVHLRDFTATLITAKWLITQLVSEVIRQTQGQAPPDGPSFHGAGLMGGSGAAGPSESPQEASEGEGPPKMPWEMDEAPEPDEDGPGGRGEDAWQPPGAKASPEERTQALQDMITQLGTGPRKLREKFDDFHESKYKSRYAEQDAKRKVKQAIEASVKNADALERKLEQSTAKMKQIVDKVRSAMRNTVNQDEWIRREAFAKVVFTDITHADIQDDVLTTSLLSLEDQEAVKRLRATFFRVMGRRRSQLEDVGVSLDVPSYIERRLTHNPIPIFRTNGTGRGFKALVLIDRSSSMKGARTKQAERACRVISRALRFPFVESHVWGFQALDAGQVDITRFEPGMEVFTTSRSKVGGYTPLHTAIRVAVRFMEDGTEAKQLFVISDGFPTFVSKGRKAYNTKQLMSFVRAEVRRARQHGVSVTGVMIGKETQRGVRSEVRPRSMSWMFGSPKHWHLMAGRKLGNDLVRLVSRSFTEYLKSG